MISRRLFLMTLFGCQASACGSHAPLMCDEGDRNIFTIARCSQEGYKANAYRREAVLLTEQRNLASAADENQNLRRKFIQVKREVDAAYETLQAINLQIIQANEELDRLMQAGRQHSINRQVLIGSLQAAERAFTTIAAAPVPPTKCAQAVDKEKTGVLKFLDELARAISAIELSKTQEAAAIIFKKVVRRFGGPLAIALDVKTLIGAYVENFPLRCY